MEDKKDRVIKYTALFVKDKEALLKRFPPIHKNVFADHSTIEFNPGSLDGIEVGKESMLKIIGRAHDEFGDDLLVENTKSKNLFPHITLSRPDNAPPFYSKELFEKGLINDTIEYFPNETVLVTEGYAWKNWDSVNEVKKDTIY